MLSGLTPLYHDRELGIIHRAIRCRSRDFPGKEIGVRESGKMSQLLRVLAYLPENMSLVPSTHTAPGEPDSLPASRAPTAMIYIHIDTLKKKNKSSLLHISWLHVVHCLWVEPVVSGIKGPTEVYEEWH